MMARILVSVDITADAPEDAREALLSVQRHCALVAWEPRGAGWDCVVSQSRWSAVVRVKTDDGAREGE
jgi:hypothetical protein